MILTAIFAALGLLHVYWAFGGRMLLSAAVPETGGGQKVLEPGRQSTALVAAALLAAALAVIGSLGLLGETIAGSVFRTLVLVMGLLFLMRAVGDFRLVGFFKHSSDSRFAYWDTRLYSPLCLVIALVAAYVAIAA